MKLDPNPPKPWGPIDPNSDHQLWSRWTFIVWESGKHPPLSEVKLNMVKWVKMVMGSVGQINIEEKPMSWRITVEIEGVPAHDPDYVKVIRGLFQGTFVEKGWGKLGASRIDVKILAGDLQDGKPRSQLIVLPTIKKAPSGWVREPSLDVCAKQCGAMCCKGPRMVQLKDEEIAQLEKLNSSVKIGELRSGGKAMMLVDQCVFLGKENQCTIYDQRPEACRKFPLQPFEGCLVWPTSLEV